MPAATNNVLHQRIISVLNLEALSDSQRAMFLDKMTDVINGRLLLRLWDNFSAELRKEFEAVIDKEEDGLLENFLVMKVPNFVEMISEETLKLKSEMVAHMRTS